MNSAITPISNSLNKSEARRNNGGSKSVPTVMTIAPDRVSPVDDFTFGVEIGFDLDRHRRSERRIRHLALSRPLHPYRPSVGFPGEQHGIERNVVGGVMSVAAGAFQMLDGDVLDRQLEHHRQIGAQ